MYGMSSISGEPSDTVDVEIYQPWLEPATAEQLQQQREEAKASRELHGHVHHEVHHAHHHEHHHEHDHEHKDKKLKPGVIDHGDHVHEERQQVMVCCVASVTSSGDVLPISLTSRNSSITKQATCILENSEY